jgi:hypothetical protein
VVDDDRDGIDDYVEQWLGERFAPIVYHGESERNFPASVDWFLSKTRMFTYDDACEPDEKHEVPGPLTQGRLTGRSFRATCQGTSTITSDSTRSRCKQATFFLSDLAKPDQAGLRNKPAEWVTYLHAYPNSLGGVTLQYWRFYAQDDDQRHLIHARVGPFEMELIPGHGGDWEGAMVHLNGLLLPASVDRLGHATIDAVAVTWVQGQHPIIWSEEGGHTSDPNQLDMISSRFIEQQTWSGGTVTLPDGSSAGYSGGLRNVGERSHPLAGQQFIRYSGLWGSPGDWFVTSGYWGPAFNETGSVCEDGVTPAYKSGVPDCSPVPVGCGRIFHTAWCKSMDFTQMDRDRECTASDQSR